MAAAAQATQVASPSPVPLNEWVHVAGVNDGAGNAYLYINGVQVASATGQNAAANVERNSNFIGKSNFSVDSFTNGQIADARVWNDARTADEIAANYNHALTGNEQGLVLNYKFEEIDGTTVSDSSSNNNDGTANGGPTIVDPRPDAKCNTLEPVDRRYRIRHHDRRRRHRYRHLHHLGSAGSRHGQPACRYR